MSVLHLLLECEKHTQQTQYYMYYITHVLRNNYIVEKLQLTYMLHITLCYWVWTQNYKEQGE